MYDEQCTMYAVQYMSHNERGTVYNVYRIMHDVECIMYDVQII